MPTRSPYARTKPPAGATIDWAHPLTAGLVGCWLFNEAGGKRAQDIAGSTHLTTSTANFGTGMNGPSAGAFAASGQNFVSAVNPPIAQIANELTIEVWERHSAWGNFNQFFRKSTADTNGYYLRINSTGPDVRFDIGIGGVAKAIVSTGGGAVLNRWNHIVAVYDGAFMRLFINMVSANTPVAVTGAIGDGATTLQIGCCTDTFTGAIDSARLWKRALTHGEIVQLYNEPYAMIRGPR